MALVIRKFRRFMDKKKSGLDTGEKIWLRESKARRRRRKKIRKRTNLFVISTRSQDTIGRLSYHEEVI